MWDLKSIRWALSTSETYDEAFLSYPPYETTRMKAMYQRAARKIPRTAPVVDLGCGNGYLASALKEAGYQGVYVGYDLSPVAVEMAKIALSDMQTTLWHVTPQYSFHVKDLDWWMPEVDETTHQTVYCCFEVLEHYQCDVTLINKLPARSRFLFSVPNFWSQTHIRTYDSVGWSYNRYAHALRYKSWEIFNTLQPEAAIYLFDSYRRADKW